MFREMRERPLVYWWKQVDSTDVQFSDMQRRSTILNALNFKATKNQSPNMAPIDVHEPLSQLLEIGCMNPYSFIFFQ